MPSLQTTPSMPLQYGKTPTEGPAATPLIFSFGSGSGQAPVYTIDYTLNQQQNFLSLVQSLYIDNEANASAVSITIIGRSNQNITFPAGFQGYVTVLVSGTVKFTVASAGTAIVNIFMINEPVMPCIWSANGTSGGGSSSVTIAGPNPLPVSITSPATLPVSIASTVTVNQATVANTFYGVAQATMTGGAILLSSLLPSGSPTTLRNLTLQAKSTNGSIIDIGGAGVTVGTGLELVAGAAKNYVNIDTTKMDVIGASGTLLNIEAIA